MGKGGRACYLEWYPYSKDRTMGLNHQMASLSCALGEAFHTGRTLLFPAQICLFALHTERWADAGGPGERCVPTTELFDIERLAQLVPVRLASAGADDAERLARPAQTVKVNQGWNSQRVAREHPCGAPGSARLVRRHVDTFWFQQCARRHTDYSQLAAALNLLVGAPPSTPKPMNIILRSGLFFSPSVKAAAAAIRGAIGGPYASLHVRRSDKLTVKSHEMVVGGTKVTVPAACSPEDCKVRDLLTRPAAIDKTLRMWLPPNSHVYIGSTEPPSFFDPLRKSYRLHFAEDFRPQLANVTNNYALYAVETLVFFGSQMSVEGLSFQSGWFVDACFPAAGLRAAQRRRDSGTTTRSPWASAAASSGNATRFAAAHAAFSGAVDLQCRDGSGLLVNGVLYGPACALNLPCGRKMYLAPQPQSCGQPPLSERLMLSPRNGSRSHQRCAARVAHPDGHGHKRVHSNGGLAGSSRKGGLSAATSAAAKAARGAATAAAKAAAALMGGGSAKEEKKEAKAAARKQIDAALGNVPAKAKGALKVDLAEASPDSLRAQLKALQEEVGSLREENERLRQASPKGGGKRRGGAAAKAEVSAHTEER